MLNWNKNTTRYYGLPANTNMAVVMLNTVSIISHEVPEETCCILYLIPYSTTLNNKWTVIFHCETENVFPDTYFMHSIPFHSLRERQYQWQILLQKSKRDGRMSSNQEDSLMFDVSTDVTSVQMQHMRYGSNIKETSMLCEDWDRIIKSLYI